MNVLARTFHHLSWQWHAYCRNCQIAYALILQGNKMSEFIPYKYNGEIVANPLTLMEDKRDFIYKLMILTSSG